MSGYYRPRIGYGLLWQLATTIIDGDYIRYQIAHYIPALTKTNPGMSLNHPIRHIWVTRISNYVKNVILAWRLKSAPIMQCGMSFKIHPMSIKFHYLALYTISPVWHLKVGQGHPPANHFYGLYVRYEFCSPTLPLCEATISTDLHTVSFHMTLKSRSRSPALN